jgi:tetratricopeptide (TPR) repeat protein
LAQRAIELGRDDAVAFTRGGHALGHFGGDLDHCIALLDRALALNPNLSAAWYLSGFQRISRGDHDDAIERFERAMRLSPLAPEMVRMQTGVAMAHLCAGRFDSASSWAEKALGELPDFLVAAGVIAASHALAGRMDQARRAMDDLRRLDPALRISNLSDWILLQRPQDLATLSDSLRLAGLPE